MPEFTQKDVRVFITHMLITGGVLKVGDDGIVYWKGAEDEPALVELDGGKGILHTYTTQAKHPDAVIINPFAEGITVSADRNWFYKVTSNIFSQSLIRTMRTLLTLAMNPDECPHPELVSYLTPIVGKVDEKLLTEFEYIVEVGTKDFCSLVYNNRAKETKLFLGIEDSTGDFQKSIPSSKVRKKSWLIFQELLRTIFKTEGPVSPEFVSSTCLVVCPHFRTYLDIWLRCWRAIEPITILVDPLNEELSIMLDEIETHVDRIDVYHKMCQWTSQVGAVQAVKSTTKRVAVPGVTAGPGQVDVIPGTPASQPEQKIRSRWEEPEPAPAPSGNRWERQPAAGFVPSSGAGRSRWDSVGGGVGESRFGYGPQAGPYDAQQESVFARPSSFASPQRGFGFGQGGNYPTAHRFGR